MSSIFDLSGQTPKKKPHKPIESKKTGVVLSDQEVNHMLEKIKGMNLDLANQLDKTEKELGVAPGEVKTKVEELKAVSAKTAEEIRVKKLELEKQILGLTEKQLEGRKSSAIAHKKRGKTLGARKGWIDMR